MSTELSPKLEMYLKTIYQLSNAPDHAPDGSVRVKDIANAMELTMPSVSEALKTLKSRGLVLHETYGGVRLSTQGRRLGEDVNNRFLILRRFLTEVLQVSPTTADVEACEIEHVVGQDTLMRLTGYLHFLEHCQRDMAGLMEHFHEYLQNYLNGSPCNECELHDGERCAADTRN